MSLYNIPGWQKVAYTQHMKEEYCQVIADVDHIPQSSKDASSQILANTLSRHIFQLLIQGSSQSVFLV